jgi:Abi-like protein
VNILRTAAINVSLERTISRDRLTKYLAATANDLDSALTLYERNMHLSEAFYTPLQILEVCLRNCINYEMSRSYGEDWLTNGKAPLQPNAIQMIREAIKASGTNYTNGDLVAEIKFAFWVSLIGPGYDETIWRAVIHKAFRAQGGKKRAYVHGRLNALRRLRNRVAHHEPIYPRAGQMHAECLEAIGWMCLDTCLWATHHSRLASIAAAP